jgi:purine-binding chemotaxis protein CheW
VSSPRSSKGSEIRWGEFRERLARVTRAIEEAERPGSAECALVLGERARRLARPPPAEPQAGEQLILAAFALSGERYGIETAFVREISRFTEFTPVPGAGDFLVGVTNLRGAILAVVDLRKFLGLAGGGVTELSRMLVLGDDRSEFGILADEVHGIVTLRPDEVLEAPAPAPEDADHRVRGVTKDALIVLDGARLLRDERLYIDQTRGALQAE